MTAKEEERLLMTRRQALQRVSALLGGALIGLAAAAMWWLLGRITGISGILGDALNARGLDLAWRVAFIAGLLAAGITAAMAFSCRTACWAVAGSMR